MRRIYDGIVRDKRLQMADFLKIALSQSTTPDNRPVSAGPEGISSQGAPFIEDIGESVISMNGGVTFRSGIVRGSNWHVEKDGAMCGWGTRGMALLLYTSWTLWPHSSHKNLHSSPFRIRDSIALKQILT